MAAGRERGEKGGVGAVGLGGAGGFFLWWRHRNPAKMLHVGLLVPAVPVNLADEASQLGK